MAKKKVSMNLVAVLLALVGITGYSLFAHAGNSDMPNGRPFDAIETLLETQGAVLETLSGISETQNTILETQNTILEAIASGSSGDSEREGFIVQLTTSDPNVLTVPQGQRFVVMQILTREPSRTWNLKIDSVQFLNQDMFGYIITSPSPSGASRTIVANFNVTFPDRCVTVEQGQTLSFETTSSPSITIVGYCYDVE